MKIYDNSLSYLEIKSLYRQFVYERKTYHIDRDQKNTYHNAIASDLPRTDPLFDRFYKILQSYQPNLKLQNLERSGINLYLPNTKMFYHKDGPIITALFYINPKVDVTEGGETQFIIDDEIVSIRPKPGRLVVFDGQIEHTATSFATIPRVTVYYKFWNRDNSSVG